MKIFFVTFGQKYADEAHPIQGRKIDPNGYVRVIAKNWQQARSLTWAAFGEYFAFIYAEKDFKFSYYPKGELMCILQGWGIVDHAGYPQGVNNL